SIRDIVDLRGTAFVVSRGREGFVEIDSTEIDAPGPVQAHADPYAMEPSAPRAPDLVALRRRRNVAAMKADRSRTAIRMPSYEQVRADPVLYAHASRVLHVESNPGNARALVQGHGDRDVWLNPPPLPLRTEEMDRVYELPYTRLPHPSYGDARIPAYEMIRF